MLAAGVLPLATAYSVSEALGFEKGVSRSFREAPIFIGIFTFLVAVGAAIAVLPNLPLIQVLLVTQVINGLLLPSSCLQFCVWLMTRAHGQPRQRPSL
jgi:Mn2+/Fe2+ NRAMP family transporter